MDKDIYLSKIRNPKSWFHYANTQKMVADSILKSMMHKKTILGLKNGDNTFIDLWINAHYHYGIGLENGFKGLIVKNNPDEIFIEEVDGKVFLKGIGKRRNTSHNLVVLAEDAKIYDMNMFKYDTDIKSFKIVLQHLTDAIKWIPKYPVPLNNEAEFRFDNLIPSVLVYGFHILDVIDPVFVLFKKEET